MEWIARQRGPNTHLPRSSGCPVARRVESVHVNVYDFALTGRGTRLVVVRIGHGLPDCVFLDAAGDDPQSHRSDAVFYIQKGRVKVVVISDQGKEEVVGILEAGQFFGEGCLNGYRSRIATTTAMAGRLITAIGKSTMIAVLHDEPKFSELFVAYLLRRNSRVEEDLIDQLFNSSEKHLAQLLLLLANFGKEGNPTHISQETLAEMIATTRSRVSFFMNKFRKLGFISYNGKIEVHRSLLNAVLYEKPGLTRDDTRV